MKNSAKKLSTDTRLRSAGAWLLLAIGTSFPLVAHAGANVWTSGGPNGGTVNALAINPSTPTTVYAGTGGGGVFKSTDSGSSWASVSRGLPGPPYPWVSALALDPTGATTLFAGLQGGSVWQLTTPTGEITTALLPTSAHSPGVNGAFYTTNLSIADTSSSAASNARRTPRTEHSCEPHP